MENIILRVVNKEKYIEILNNVPYRTVEDLAIIYAIDKEPPFDSEEDLLLKGIVTNEMLRKLGLTEVQLHNVAVANSNRLHPAKYKDIFSLCNDIVEDWAEITPPERSPEYVISNDTRSLGGAAVIFYSNVLDKLADLYDNDLFICPSSTNEVIAYNASESDAEDLKEVVMNANRECVPDNFFLSDHVYRYDREEKKLSIAA